MTYKNPDDEGWRPRQRRCLTTGATTLDHDRAVLAAFARVEVARRAMEDAANEMSGLIAHDPRHEWPTLWQQFLDAGGVSHDELRRFMVDKKRIRTASRHQHLRLMVDKHRSSIQPSDNDHAA